MKVNSFSIGNNLNLGDKELFKITNLLTSIYTQSDQELTLRELDLSYIGASAQTICQVIKTQLCKLTSLKSLDLSGNTMSYFCVDTIVNTLLNSRVKLESLYLKATKLDKMAAFYLV